MKNLIFVFLIMFLSCSSNAQLSFETKEMITVTNNKKSVENINGKITISSDTSEIEVQINEITYKEKIGNLSFVNDFGDYDVFVYEQEEGILILHVLNMKLDSIVFSTKDNKLEFK